MKKTIQVPVSVEETAGKEAQVHPLQKSYMIVSKKHVNYNDMSAFESVSLSLVLVLAVFAGTVMSLNV